jgi:hypothetical protein
LGGHSEQGCDPKGDPSWDGILVQPEADPRHNHQHATGDIDGEHVVGKLSLENQLHFEATVFSCKQKKKKRRKLTASCYVDNNS